MTDDTYITTDREASARRIARDIEVLSGSAFTRSAETICRYAYTEEYRRTVEYVSDQLNELGFSVHEDAVGTVYARNRPIGEPVYAMGSHCDSNRGGGAYDGTLGVLAAVEVCRLNQAHGLDLPLQVIVFLEEEASGFGVGLLGSRIIAQQITEDELRAARAVDDGRPFFDHAREAGYHPEQWRESIHILDDVVGFIELHIEQGRVLEDAGEQVGVVTAINGMVWSEVTFTGRADHAGGTPMELRNDAGCAAAECVLELERLAREADGVVATTGVVRVEPGIITTIPGAATLQMDIRCTDDTRRDAVERAIKAFARKRAEHRGLSCSIRELQQHRATVLDRRIVAALEGAAAASGAPYRSMPSGGLHDTVLVAHHVPSAMVFVPCREGISHSPREHAEASDTAVAVEVTLNAIASLV
jgi:hydantoinase/carbamoylase family amidase